MTYDGKLLARARTALDRIRTDNETEHQLRLAAAYAARPEIRRCDEEMRAQMTELVRITLAHENDGAEKIEKLREENLALQARRRELLRSLGHEADWLDTIVSCKKCGDSGVYGGGVCDCLKKLYNAELTRDVGVLLKNGDESFEKFDLTLYEGPARETMKSVFEIARDYAEHFSPASGNLLFQGGTGLGKTFLSACVARVVAAKGYSVCYDSASAVIAAFEAQKFDRSEEADARVRRMLACDLMILDDLGTEMATPFADSALYTLINTRLNEGKNTVISTNLGYDELERRYTAQIFSRLRGSYERLPFFGKDIRQLKK
ncbi:MAG: ATP-binding protein [Oscillospiraceae bacterium]|nr:ATP-binding protein [Oscillospiraceae bacterium]